jgi:hypothetical protein
MNDFYQLPKSLQWIISMAFLLLGLFLAIFIIEKGNANPFFYAIFIVYVPISQFLYTPLFTLTGGYTYYSPMLLGYGVNDQQIDLHSGTSFDHLLVLRNVKPGLALRNKILQYHLEGLLNLISLIEKKQIPASVTVVGTSYFFSNRTLTKLGFQIENASLFYRANLFINFLDLFWMYSLSRGKVSFPALWDAKKAMIKGDQLLTQKKALEMLYERLK